MPTIKIHNATTGQITEREMTTKETKQLEIDHIEMAENMQKIEAKEAARQAVLDKLGLTADEVAALGL
jgi:hypothetical protein